MAAWTSTGLTQPRRHRAFAALHRVTGCPSANLPRHTLPDDRSCSRLNRAGPIAATALSNRGGFFSPDAGAARDETSMAFPLKRMRGICFLPARQKLFHVPPVMLPCLMSCAASARGIAAICRGIDGGSSLCAVKAARALPVSSATPMTILVTVVTIP